MDLRRFFDRFIDTTNFTDEQLKWLLQIENKKEELRKEIVLYKQSLQLEECK